MRELGWFVLGVLLGGAVVYLALAPVGPPSAPTAKPVPAQQPAVVAPVSPWPGDGTASGAPRPPASGSASPPGPLLIPVQGVGAAQLQDTFNDARGEGRHHDAIDIMAPAGTPVLAADDGHVEKLFDSRAGGLTVYQFNPARTHAYYYAHLQGYASGLAEGQALRRGQVIGYVGATGNASPDAPHLHFAVFELGPERRWWEGTAINPYPLLDGPAR